jgi:hypothetical protein
MAQALAAAPAAPRSSPTGPAAPTSVPDLGVRRAAGNGAVLAFVRRRQGGESGQVPPSSMT